MSTAGLEASKIRSADQRACSYDQKPITLDGQIDLNISFGENTLCTAVYIKLVAPDALLLSESVCRTLGVVSYHPNVQVLQKGPVTITPITILIKIFCHLRKTRTQSPKSVWRQWLLWK